MTPDRPASRIALIAAYATIYVVWGSTYLGVRVAVASMPPFTMAGLRFLIAGTILFIFLKARGLPWPTRTQWRDNALIGAGLLLGSNALVAWAEQTVPSGLATLILGSSPMILVLVDWAKPGGKAPSGPTWVGVIVGMVGVAILLGPGAFPDTARPPLLSVVALVAASAFWWIGSLYSRHVASNAPPLMASALQMLTGSALMLATGVLTGEAPRWKPAAVTAASWWAFAYLVIIGSLIVFPVYVWLIKHSKPALVATYAYVNPVVAVILGWAILGEPLTARIAVGGAVIVGAVALVTAQKHAT